MDDFSSIIGFIPAEYHSTILAALTVASLALPLLQWIANKTANTWDNALVARIEWLLARVPRIGLGNTQRAAESVARASLKPPPTMNTLGNNLLVFGVFGLGVVMLAAEALGCAGSPADAALQNRIAANELRDTVNDASDTLAQAHGAIPFVCAYYGDASAACKSLEDGYRITASAIDTVHRAIDLLDAIGVGAEQTRTSAETVLAEAKALGAAVQRAGEEVANGLAKGRDRSTGGPGGTSDEQPAEQAAPAEDTGAPTAGVAQ